MHENLPSKRPEKLCLTPSVTSWIEKPGFDPPAGGVSDDTAAQLDGWIAKAEAMLAPAGKAAALAMLGKLSAILKLPRDMQTLPKAVLAEYASDLASYPYWALVGAYHTLKREQEWWPALATIRKAADPELEKLKRQRYKLQILHKRAFPPPPRNRPGPPAVPTSGLVPPNRPREESAAPRKFDMARLDAAVPDAVRALAAKRRQEAV